MLAHASAGPPCPSLVATVPSGREQPHVPYLEESRQQLPELRCCASRAHRPALVHWPSPLCAGLWLQSPLVPHVPPGLPSLGTMTAVPPCSGLSQACPSCPCPRPHHRLPGTRPLTAGQGHPFAGFPISSAQNLLPFERNLFTGFSPDFPSRNGSPGPGPGPGLCRRPGPQDARCLGRATNIRGTCRCDGRQEPGGPQAIRRAPGLGLESSQKIKIFFKKKREAVCDTASVAAFGSWRKSPGTESDGGCWVRGPGGAPLCVAQDPRTRARGHLSGGSPA